MAAPAIAATFAMLPLTVRADDVSDPVILQYFEGSYSTITNRMPDIFAAGYGGLYTPPPGRADSGNQSVGYDQYDRFDLGSAGNPTLYGTETGLKAAINSAHTAGLTYGIDMVWNQSGFSDENTNSGSFLAAGGYPGFALTLNSSNNSKGYVDQYGDYHNYSDTGDEAERLAGLIDIDQSKNYVFIRQPTTAGPNNIPAGTTSWNGRLANVPNPLNAQYYPDTSLTPKHEYNPETGQNVTVYPFNTANPMAGDPVPENALGYLMRNTQWLVQDLGVDFFRLDAVKNMPSWELEYYDQAVYGASNRTLLNGQKENVWAFSEYYDGSSSDIANSGVVNYSINNNPVGAGTIGGNRDALDFPLFFAMQSNLSSNGESNDWNNIVNASLDVQDDGLHNGSQGVKFVSSPDDFGPDLSNVAYAYTLMMPGQAIVYSNNQQFGTNRSFPKDGRGDALGGMYGNAITTLVNLRNEYGRGNYQQRYLTKELYAFERQQSALVMLDNRGDSGYDQATFNVGFQPGQYLVELTGNATSSTADPNNSIPSLLQVQGTTGNAYVNARFLRNEAPGTGSFTGDGYLIYGLATPQGTLSLTNVGTVLAGGVPNTSGMTADQIADANATTRLANVDVIKTNSFAVTLNTNKVILTNNQDSSFSFHDHDADGDNALIELDGGVDINGNGTVDFRTPGSDSYGFENFTTVKQDGYDSANNNGTYTQNISTAGLSEGYHYIDVRAFRHRTDGGDAIWTDFRQTIYVDRLPPVVAQYTNVSYDGNSADRDFTFQSTDKTATEVHTFLNLPANLTNAQIIAMVSGNNTSSQTDRDLFKRGFAGIPSGNNVITAVTYEIDGNVNVQRFTGINLTTSVGKGLGDVDHNGSDTAADVTNATGCFESLLYPNAQGQTNTAFNPAADINGDGKIDDQDLFLLPGVYKAANATAAQNAAQTAIRKRANINGVGGTDGSDITALEQSIGHAYSWTNDLNSDGAVNQADVDTMVHTVLKTEYGDATLNGVIDSSDFSVLAANYGKTGETWSQGDFNGDGIVNALDFNALASHYGFNASTAAAIPTDTLGSIVPEPVGAGFLAVLAMFPMRRRSRRSPIC